MDRKIDSQPLQGAQVEFLDVVGGRLKYSLELVVVLQAVGVFTIAAISGAAAWLHIGRAPGLGADGAQECTGVEGAGTYLQVQWLHDDTALFGPVLLQGQDQSLECANV